MPFIDWKESYNIGVKEIDIQHRGLFDIINKLYSRVDYEPEGKYFLLTFNKLIEYAQVHFSTEERYMKEAGYGRYSEHKAEHAHCLEELTKMAAELAENKYGTKKNILDYLKSWYNAHILGEDRDYLDLFRSKGFR